MRADTTKGKIKEYKILSVDASELFNHAIKNEPFCICNKTGKIDFDMFTASIYNSLETKKLKSVYEAEKKNRNVIGSFELKEYLDAGKEDQRDKYSATLSVINVTFEKAHKGSKKSKEQLREWFYENNIKIKTLRRKGEKESPIINTYVRYKRSAGSSREGNCLFILEPLKKKMMKWSACGFDESRIADKVSWESYISLTLSNAQCEIRIPKEAILFIPDAESCFYKDIISVKKDGESIAALPECVPIKNKIWDGQALLDESVFEENEPLNHKGMALLRNRFFKTCAFNTKLQKWFQENGITELSQLHPEHITKAKSISDIKLVVTDSSLKSIKLKQSELSETERKDRAKCKEKAKEAIELWLRELEENFGVVKTDKPTRFFGGQMVQTSYQLINTLDLNEAELTTLTAPALDYLSKIMNDPMYMRYYLHCEIFSDGVEEYEDEQAPFDEEQDDEETEFVTLRKQVNFELLSYNDDYSKTCIYDDFRQNIRQNYLNKIKKGRLLVPGTNATLFGNGYEMLAALTNPAFDFSAPVAIALSGNEVRNTFFMNSEEILCARSPHVTMGNLFVAKNKLTDSDAYSSWFNLTNEIICVNSIEESLMDRLNGCDFDSDSMLISNDPIMLNAAKRNYIQFGVPVADFEYKTENKAVYQIDIDISNNKIGEIINTSQWLNSIFWDKKANGVFDTELYYDICKLAVLAGIEIDKAKRNYGIIVKEELRLIKQKYGLNLCKPKKAEAVQKEELLRPSFMKLVKKREYSLYDTENERSQEYSDQYQTAMQVLQTIVTTNAERKNYTGGKIGLSMFLPQLAPKKLDNEYRYAKEIVKELNQKYLELSGLRKGLRCATLKEKVLIWEKIREIELQCVGFVKKKMKSHYVTKILVEKLDAENPETEKIKSLLLSCICSANDDFYSMVSFAGKELLRYELKMNPFGEERIFGIKHAIVPVG